MIQIFSNEDLGAKINVLLAENSMTVEDLASRLNLKKRVLQKKIKGKEAFSYPDLCNIAEIFSIGIEELLKRIADSSDIESIYHKLTLGKLSELKEYDLSTIANKDIYGKCLVEYILEENKVDLLKYLIDNHIEVVHPYDEKASDILLSIIECMLINDLSDPIDYIIKFSKINKTFDLEHPLIDTIYKLIEHNNVLLQKLMSESFLVNEKALIKKPLLLVQNDTWIRVIAKNQLDNTFAFYLKNFELIGNIKKLILEFVKYDYRKGLYTIASSLDENTVGIIVYDLDIIKALLSLEDFDIAKAYIDKGLLQNIDVIDVTAIKNQSFDLISNLILTFPDFDIRLIGKTAVKVNKTEVLDLFIERANQDDLDYLLSEANPQDKKVLLYLTMHGALFNNLYLSKITTNQANEIISLLKGDNEK